MRHPFLLFPWILCFGLLLVGAGCGPRLPYYPPEIHHIKKAWSLCGAYKANHNGKVPQDIEAVKKWAIQEGKAAEEDFISPRDKQLYQVQCTPPPMGFILVYEQTGENGKRLVVNQGGTAVEVNENEFKSLVKSMPKPRKDGKG